MHQGVSYLNAREGQRPDYPDAELLARARLKAADILEIRPGNLSWRTLERIERPQSTLFRLSLASGTESLLQAYCKYHSIMSPGSLSHSDSIKEEMLQSKEATFRRVLTIGSTLSEVFAERFSSLGIEVPRVLATSIHLFADIQIAIQGIHAPRDWEYRIPGRLEDMKNLYYQIGRSIRCFELLSDCRPYPSFEDLPDLAASLASSAQFQTSRPSDEVLTRIDEIRELQDEAVRGQQVVRSHGDMNRYNLISTANGLGVIDSLWATRLRGYDLAVVAARLAADRQVSEKASKKFIQGLLAGYGESEISSTPQWRLAQMVLSARVYDRASARMRYRRA